MPINDGICCDSCNSIVLGARLWRQEKEKPDTPDIDRIEEINNPEKKVFATSIQLRLHNKLDKTSKLAWGLVGDKVELIEFKD